MHRFILILVYLSIFSSVGTCLSFFLLFYSLFFLSLSLPLSGSCLVLVFGFALVFALLLVLVPLVLTLSLSWLDLYGVFAEKRRSKKLIARERERGFLRQEKYNKGRKNLGRKEEPWKEGRKEEPWKEGMNEGRKNPGR
jgi:hypothetical protein